MCVQKGANSLLLDPVGYDVAGAEGVADLYLMPAYDPMASLYFDFKTLHSPACAEMESRREYWPSP
jgi:hypothetical protein